ncbi:MAG: nucleotide exchange factor GrpE, partial [Halanaerobiales bacterium]
MADRINENEEMESVTPENEEELNTDSVKTEDNNNDSETFNLSSDSEDEERISAENSDKNNGAENNEDADNDEDTASEDIDSGNINGDSYDEEGKELNVLELLNTVAKLEDTIVRLEAEKESLNNRHKRLQADFANYRKRTDREIGKVQSTVVVELIRELLPIIDNFERALAQDESESDFRKGIEMI